MNYQLSNTMHEAMRLMQTGDLHAATAAIQRGLAGSDDRPIFHPGYADNAAAKPWIEAISPTSMKASSSTEENPSDASSWATISSTILALSSPATSVSPPAGSFKNIHSRVRPERAGTGCSFPRVIAVGRCRCL